MPLAFPPFTPARRLDAQRIVAQLRRGEAVTDEQLDAFYPRSVESVSCAHWTPVRVAMRVVELLELAPSERFLDIGAGVGKLCIIAAATSKARIRGVESRTDLAAVAREAAARFGVSVDITDGSFENEDPRELDAAYIFNPFTESIVVTDDDDDADPAPERAAADIAAAQRFFERARPGTRVVTFCGFGGALPPSYARRAHEVWNEGALELWVRSRS